MTPTMETPTYGEQATPCREERAYLPAKLFHQQTRTKQLELLATLGNPLARNPELNRTVLYLTKSGQSEKPIAEFFIERKRQPPGCPWVIVGWDQEVSSTLSSECLPSLDDLDRAKLEEILDDYLDQRAQAKAEQRERKRSKAAQLLLAPLLGGF